MENLLDQLPRPFLLLGDFNAHSPVWGDSRQDCRGKLIESILQDNDLILLNSKSPTFVHSASNSTSAIDIAVASPTIALDFQWSVHDVKGKTSREFPGLMKSVSKQSWIGRGPKGNILSTQPFLILLTLKKLRLKVNLLLNSPRLLRGDLMSPRSIPTLLVNQFGRKFEKSKAKKPPQKLI